MVAGAVHEMDGDRAVAHFEHNGLPINQERFPAIRENARKLQLDIVREIERVHNYGVDVIEGARIRRTSRIRSSKRTSSLSCCSATASPSARCGRRRPWGSPCWRTTISVTRATPTVSELWKPFDARTMRCYPASPRINYVANDYEQCSRSVEFADAQNRLFSWWAVRQLRDSRHHVRQARG